MITNDEIISIAQNILTTMVDANVTVSNSVPEARNTVHFTGCVQITGEWHGAVVVQAYESVARSLACGLLAIDDSELLETDLRDAFAEVTNMIGGNIKGQVPSPSFLSIPSVTTGQDFDFHLPGTTVLQEVKIRCVGGNCSGGGLRIMLCEEDPNQVSRTRERSMQCR